MLLFKKHPRLYRERIVDPPPWPDYAVVALSLGALVLWCLDIGGSALVSGGFALGIVAATAFGRLRRTARTPGQVLEVLATSAVLPFLSVYWRLRGALRFRVPYF